MMNALNVIVFGVLILTGLIFLSILRLRYIAKKDDRHRRQAYARMESFLLKLLAEEIIPHQWAVRISAHELDYLQEFLLPYLESLKGESLEKLVAVAHYSGLVKRLLQEGHSAEAWKLFQNTTHK